MRAEATHERAPARRRRRRRRARRRSPQRRTARCSAAIPSPSQRRPSSVSSGERERAHRALALARVLAHLVAGAARRALARPPAATTVVVVRSSPSPRRSSSCIIVEGVCRSIGFVTAPRIAVALAPLIDALELVLCAGAARRRRARRGCSSACCRRHARGARRAARGGHRAVPAGRRRRGRRLARRAGAAARRLLARRHRGARGDGAARGHRRHRADDARGARCVDRVRSSEHARFPVYDDTLDNVVGILYAKDLLPFVIDDDEPMLGWQTLVRPPSFIPTSKPIDEQLRDFKASHTHIAIVSDEFGGTAGLVTIEDVLEEIVGEIHDEYDDEEPEVEQEEGRRFWVSGRLPLDELSELLGAGLRARGPRDRGRPGVRAVRPRAAAGRGGAGRRRTGSSSSACAGAASSACTSSGCSRRRRTSRMMPRARLLLARARRSSSRAHRRRHGDALGEPHLAAALGGAAASRLRAALAYLERPQRLHHRRRAPAVALAARAQRRAHRRAITRGSRGELAGALARLRRARSSSSASSCRAPSRGASLRRWRPRSRRCCEAAAMIASPIVDGGTAAPAARSRAPASTRPESERDTIQDLLREGELEGVGEREEMEIITGVMTFGEKTRARSHGPARRDLRHRAARPRPRAIAEEFATSAFSRAPVYDGNLDHVVGMMHAFDVLKVRGERAPDAASRGHDAATTRRAASCSSACCARSRHLAIVQDEDERTVGLVTLEDLLEELVGDIRDEHDEPAPRADDADRRCTHERLLADFAAGRKAALARAISIVENHRAGLRASCSPRCIRSSATRAASASPVRRARERARSRRALARALPRAGAHRRHRRRGSRRRRSPAARCSAIASAWRTIALDPGVYIRSLATRGSLGGLVGRDARGVRRARRVRHRPHPHRDGGRRAERARCRAHRGHEPRGARARSRATRSRR